MLPKKIDADINQKCAGYDTEIESGGAEDDEDEYVHSFMISTSSNETESNGSSDSKKSDTKRRTKLVHQVPNAMENLNKTWSYENLTSGTDEGKLYLSSTPVYCSGDEDINMPSTSGLQFNRMTALSSSRDLDLSENKEKRYHFSYDDLVVTADEQQQEQEASMHQVPETLDEHVIMPTNKNYGNDGDAVSLDLIRNSRQLQAPAPEEQAPRRYITQNGSYLLHNSLMGLVRTELDPRWKLLQSSWCFFRCNFCLIYSKTGADSAFTAFRKHRETHLVSESEKRDGNKIWIRRQKCFCDMTFNTESALLYHIACVHLRVLFTCMFCGERYMPTGDDTMHYCTSQNIRYNNLKLTRCAFCNEQILTTILAEHVVLEHSRYVMELVIMEWQEDRGFEELQQLMRTKKEIIGLPP